MQAQSSGWPRRAGHVGRESRADIHLLGKRCLVTGKRVAAGGLMQLSLTGRELDHKLFRTAGGHVDATVCRRFLKQSARQIDRQILRVALIGRAPERVAREEFSNAGAMVWESSLPRGNARGTRSASRTVGRTGRHLSGAHMLKSLKNGSKSAGRGSVCQLRASRGRAALQPGAGVARGSQRKAGARRLPCRNEHARLSQMYHRPFVGPTWLRCTKQFQ